MSDKSSRDPDDQPTAEERKLFRRIAAGARPLELDVVEPVLRRPRARARFSRLDERQALAETPDAGVSSAETDNGDGIDGLDGLDGLRYSHPSIGRKTLRKLARGGFSVHAATDLHGLTAAEAKAVLLDFIDSSIERGYTCVRIVHGKGLRSGHNGPVLKRKVDHWLRQWQGILAFVSARPVDGGTGAVYVLLKKQ